MPAKSFTDIAVYIKQCALQLGFQQVAITDTDLSVAEKKLQYWLENNMHGDMDYMSRHGLKRSRPNLLVAGTIRIISLRMDYYPEDFANAEKLLQKPEKAYISRYALGRDYHKLIRQRLKRLVSKIKKYNNIKNTATDKNNKPYQYRVFTDSAPVLEKPVAQKAGLGWIGKHGNLINSQAGSWFFLAEIYTNLPLPVDNSIDNSIHHKKKFANHCGSCTRCIQQCPTDAIVKPYVVDARKCISYLTIENKAEIPEQYRSLIGNRIYGCDDCQLVCPWNKFSCKTLETDFLPRHQLDKATLLELFGWSEQQFLNNLNGSPIRRIGYISWLRNITIALGNYLAHEPTNQGIIKALITAMDYSKTNRIKILQEHIQWSLDQGLE